MDTYMYKCPNCGSGMEYDADTHIFHCEYCLSDFTADELEEKRKKAEAAAAESDRKENITGFEEHSSVYSCPNCGAEIVTDETTAASFCYYCHNPVVLSGRLEGEFKPDYIIPFKFDKEEAERKFYRWIKSKKLLPGYFTKVSALENLYGVYYPYWMTDCTVKGDFQATGRNIKVWISGELEYTETKVYEIKREGTIEFDNIKNFAMKGDRAKPAMAVQPFRDEGIEEFKMAYLSGFMAEKRNVEYSETKETVRGQVEEYTKKIFESSIDGGYGSVSNKSLNSSIIKSSHKYILLPVWVVTYVSKGKTYYFAINGQTGKTVGKLPLSKAKTAAVAAAIFLISFLVVFGIGVMIV